MNKVAFEEFFNADQRRRIFIFAKIGTEWFEVLAVRSRDGIKYNRVECPSYPFPCDKVQCVIIPEKPQE